MGLEAEIASDKKSLGEATAIREKQLAEFHGFEKDNIQYIENLKAAIEVLSKHNGAGPGGGPVFKTEKDSWGSKSALWGGALLQTHEFPSSSSHAFDEFLRANALDGPTPDEADLLDAQKQHSKAKFLQQKEGGSLATESTWSM